jgi:hypothetical protein
MKMNFFSLALLACALGAISPGLAGAGMVSFVFANNSEFDEQPAGATMTRDDGNAANAIKITSLEVGGPDFDASGVWNGSTFNTAHTFTGVGQMSIDTIDDDAPAWGTTGNEANGWDAQEYWVFEFDVDVTFDNITIVSFGNSESMTVTIDFIDYPISGNNSVGDSFDDPFAGLVVPAGTDIRITGGGEVNGSSSVATSHWRMASFTVTEIVPEPSSAMLLLSGLAALVVRRKR